MKNKPYNQTEAITTYTVNDHYQVTAGPAAMCWNDNGYLTARGADDFAWTALGQLAQAEIDGGSTLDYLYDAFGRRVKTTNGSQVNRILYHGWHMIGEWDDTADEWLWQEAPWNSGERMLEHIALDTSDMDGDENVDEYRQYAVHEDFQDTVWGLSGTDATIAERYNYTDPYGQSDSEDGSGNGLGNFATQVFHRKRLHGGFVELESELCDFRNRWMSAISAAWCTRDPLRYIDGMNQYSFVLCAPLSSTDQSGGQTVPRIEDPKYSRICYDPGAGETCAPLLYVKDLCLSDYKSEFEGQKGIIELIDGICSTSLAIICQCSTNCPMDDRGGRLGGRTSALATITIEIFYKDVYQLDGTVFQYSEPYSRGHASSYSRKCCPCMNKQMTTLFHEAYHALEINNGWETDEAEAEARGKDAYGCMTRRYEKGCEQLEEGIQKRK